MNRTHLIVQNDTNDIALISYHHFCQSVDIEMCNRCQLRFICFSCRHPEILIPLTIILAKNKRYKGGREAKFMIEEYLFGHMLNLEESAKVKIW